MAEAVVSTGPLKDLNAKRLFAVLLLNAVAFYLAERSAAVSVGGALAFVTGWASAWPAGIGATLTGVLNGQISSDAKARLVFLRWACPYPGCRAFTHYGPNAMNVDMLALEQKHGPLPTEPKAQNTLWFRLFNGVSANPAVVHAHRHFLFARDYAFISLVLLAILGIAGAMMIRPFSTYAIYLTALVAQWALATNAANLGGKRLVTIVLAHSAAKS